MLCLDDIGTPDDEPLRQPRAHRLGNIGHRVKIGDAAVIEPVEHLFRAQFGLTRVEPCFFEQFTDARAGEANKVNATIFARRDVTRDGNRVHLARDGHKSGVCHD